MKKNIFILTILSFILIFISLFISINVYCNSMLKTLLENAKQTTLSYLKIAASEIKNYFIKSDDIPLLYSTEYISKIKNISEVFITDKNLTVLMHNDSNKWNTKVYGDVYTNAINSNEQIIQQINTGKMLYSFPIDENAVAFIVLTFEDIIDDYNTLKNKLYLYSLILSFILSVILYLLCSILFLAPFIKTKKILTLQGNNKKTIYWELVDMARKSENKYNKQELDFLKILKEIIDKLNKWKNDVVAVLDNKATVIYNSEQKTEIFNDSKTNVHIMEATNNMEIIKTVSNLMEEKSSTEEIELPSLQLKISAVKHNNVLSAIIITTLK